MNKILNLFDQAYVMNLFNREILPLYPGFKKIKKIKIIPMKKQVWSPRPDETWAPTYHVVIRFATTFSAGDGQTVELPIYCTAHSSEPREDSFAALSFLWRLGFGQSDLTVPRPLIFSDYFNGYFYRGVQGQTLYYYLCKKNYEVIEKVVAKTAAWFAKLHGLPTGGFKNFNPANSRIRTTIPGLKKILKKIERAYPTYYQSYKKIYEIINKKESEYYSRQKKLFLIHGDAHAKNVIKINENKIAIIDYTDMCLADFTRDLGSFLQQLDFMGSEKIKDQAYIEKIKKIFIKNYQLHSKIKIDGSTKKRINNYYNWTALRTATFFLLKVRPEPARARKLLIKICRNLKIKAEF